MKQFNIILIKNLKGITFMNNKIISLLIISINIFLNQKNLFTAFTPILPYIIKYIIKYIFPFIKDILNGLLTNYLFEKYKPYTPKHASRPKSNPQK